MSTIKFPVAIIGGGEVGLVTSILLSLQGIGHVLFEKHPGTSIHPKAIGLHVRTMEILRKMGGNVAEEIRKISAPPESFKRTSWYTSFGKGDGESFWGREIDSRPAFGNVEDDELETSPERTAVLAQIRFEPVLRRRAEELNPQGMLFNHEVDSIEEKADHVEVRFHAKSGSRVDQSQVIQATYVIGADGGHALTEVYGKGWKGEADIADMVTAHIRSPLSLHAPDPGTLIYWIVNPEEGGSIKSGVAYHLGPYPIDPKTEEWSIFVARRPDEIDHPFSQSEMMKRLQKIFRVPNLPIEILSMSHWHLQAKHASQYISDKGRIFLVGDAAHRIPPWGGIGGNTGMQDADNLVWKLALALKSDKTWNTHELLQSYDRERKRVGHTVATNSLYNFKAHGGAVDKALGLSPELSREDNVKAMNLYFNIGAEKQSDEDREVQREAVQKATHKTLDSEFRAVGLEAGFFYDHSSICDNEKWTSPQIDSEGNFNISTFFPCTVPGHNLPHAWITSAVGERTSTRHLAKPDKLVLLASSDAWRTAKHSKVEVQIIGEAGDVDVDWLDSEKSWARQREVGSTGAVLVRPDNIVAYRWMDDEVLQKHPDISAEIDRVVRRVLMVPRASL